jgi:hypothetical protein
MSPYEKSEQFDHRTNLNEYETLDGKVNYILYIFTYIYIYILYVSMYMHRYVYTL